MSYDALDDFAGPGGWDEGARMVGLSTVGIEWDMAACQTAAKAGHARIRADVGAYPSAPFVGVRGYIASPPCQAWSMAGKRKGELDRANCHVLADRMAQGDDSTDWTEWEDPRSALVCQPVRRVRELRPEWVALEEVPAVLGLWEHFGRIFREWGYKVWVGVLNAADYGVPQTRQRCILMASRRTVGPPVPTHAKSADDGDLFGSSRLGWVSMARALGWERRLEVNTRGARKTPGGNEFPADRPSWARCVRPISEPSPTLTSSMDNGDFQWVHERPATTVVGSFNPDVISPPGYRTEVSRQNAEGGVRVTVAEGGVLQSFPADYPWQGSRTKQYQQVGNAIPPLLAAHILAALTGRAMEAAA